MSAQYRLLCAIHYTMKADTLQNDNTDSCNY